jgi:hypothetical protein
VSFVLPLALVLLARPGEPIPLEGATSVKLASISGSLAITANPGARALIIDAEETPKISRDGDRLTVKLGEHDARIELPPGLRLEVVTVSGNVQLGGSHGAIRMRSTGGDLRFEGQAASVEARTLSGSVSAHGAIGELRVETTSGDVSLRGASGQVSVRTTSGDVAIESSAASRLDLASVSGDLRYAGALGAEGASVRSVSGSVRLELDAPLDARLEARSKSGSVRAPGLEGGGHTVDLAVGPGKTPIRVVTLSGDIELRAVDRPHSR